MGRLIHRTAPGTSYFVTTKTWENRALFQVTEIAEIVIEAMIYYRDRNEFLPHEFVLMPDHLHVLLTPSATNSLEKAMQFIKGGSAYRIHQQRGHKMQLWQAGFHDWTIRDANDWRTKADYIRMNPVEAGLIERAENWPYSSANGKLSLDPMPERYANDASGAKAPNVAPPMSDLKVRPPEEPLAAPGLKSPKEQPLATRGLKPPPPKEAR